MSKPRTKDEVLEFLKDNPESANKLLELVADIAFDAMADDEENDLPLSPGKWFVGHTYSQSVFTKCGGMIADCEGPNAEADAVAMAALPGLLRACRGWFNWLSPQALCAEQRKLYDAAIAAGIDMEGDDNV